MASPAPTSRGGRLNNFLLAFRQTRQTDPRLILYMVGAAVLVLLVFAAVGFFTDNLLLWALGGIPVALLAAMFIFGQRASAAAIGAIEGQPGAAAAVLQSMRGDWRVRPAVAFTRKQDFVHRAVGRPG